MEKTNSDAGKEVEVEVTVITKAPHVCAQTGPRQDPVTKLPKPYRIGIIGGTSPTSTTLYYNKINARVNTALGGLTSAPIHLASLEFGQIDAFMRQNDWERIFNVLDTAVGVFHYAEVDAVAIASNTLHRLAPQLIEESLDGLPLIHIGEAIAQKVKETDIKRVGFFGTKETMQADFITGYIKDLGVEVVVPNEEDQNRINSAIFQEYCRGEFNTANRRLLFNIACELCRDQEIEGLVLGCTELGSAFSEEWQKMLIRGCTGVANENEKIPIELPILSNFYFFDSEDIHVNAIVDFCLNGPRL